MVRIGHVGVRAAAPVGGVVMIVMAVAVRRPVGVAVVHMIMVGMAMMSSMGGASGAIFGTFFRNGGKALAGKETLDAAGLAAFLQAGVEGVKQRGGAAVGDKTVVDAMEPAAVKAAEVAGQDLPAAITAAITLSWVASVAAPAAARPVVAKV